MPELLSTQAAAPREQHPKTIPAAEQGYTAEQGYDATAAAPSHRTLRWWIALVVVVATLLEGLVFNHFYFRYALGDYQSATVPLPYHEQLGEPAYVFSPQQKSLVVSGLDVDMMTLGFKLKGEHSLLSGSVSVTDDSSIVNLRPAATFKVAPSEVQGNDFTRTTAEPVKLLVRGLGQIHSVAISFDKLQGVVVLTDLTLNVKPSYYFSLLRWLTMVLMGSALIGLVRQRWYQLRLGDLSRRGFRIVQGLSLMLCLSLSLGYGYLMLPSHMSPTLTYDYLEHGFAKLGNPENSLLLDFPRTPQEVEYHDPYVQNLDAWLKGQLNIDVVIDEDFLKAQDSPYLFDMGWRAQQGIEGFWDRSFYNGKFYAYYGYGPMLVFYLPLYLITGCAPSPTLAITFFTVVAILGLYLGIFALSRFSGILPRANAVVWTLVQAAAVLGTHILLVQAMLRFYAYAPLLAAGLLGLVTYVSYTLPSIKAPHKKRLLLIAIGLILVLIVHTRPFMLIPALALCGPIFWYMATAGYSCKDKLLDALCVGVPLTIGASVTMVLNYLRFDSVWEFGQRLCITLDHLQFKTLDFNLELLIATIKFFITRPWVALTDFPFYGISREWANHIGFYSYGEFYVGLLASPVWWGLALVVALFMTRRQPHAPQANVPQYKAHAPEYKARMPQSEAQPKAAGLTCVDCYGINRDRLFTVTLLMLLVLVPIIWYVELVSTSYSPRYTMENGAALVAFLVVLWAKFISYAQDAPLQSKVCYWAALWAMVMTIVMESLAPFSVLEQEMPYLVPDEWVSVQAFFTPISTVH